MMTIFVAAAAALSLGVGSTLTSANAHQMTGSNAALHAFQTAESEQQDVRRTAESDQHDVRTQLAVYTPSNHGNIWNDEPIG